MENLRLHIQNNNYIWDCPNCFKKIYKYIGIKPIPIHGTINSQDFKPMSKKVTKPVPGQSMLCPFCKKPLGYTSRI